MKSLYKYLIIMFLAVSFTAKAQSLEEIIGFDDDVRDMPEAPINGLIGVALAAGAYFGFRKFKK
jgi:hypothetical protein